MNNNYKELLPKWFEEQTKHDLVLSDDLDSLLSCAILNKVKGWKVRYFYDFEHTYVSTKLKDEYKNGLSDRVWVDVAILNGEKAFDNHVSMVSLEDDGNPNMINPNLFCYITNENYEDKYAGSTALMLWSLYGLPLPKTDKGKMLLLCIDSSYKGHYSDRFNKANTFYVKDVLGFTELYDLMNRKTYDDFYELTWQYGLNNKLNYEDGKIHTRLDIDEIGELLGIELNVLEDDVFVLWKEYEICDEDIRYYHRSCRDISTKAFTLAFTFKNKARYSKIKESEEEKEWKRREKMWWCSPGRLQGSCLS
jgi:hypothetical protein